MSANRETENDAAIAEIRQVLDDIDAAAREPDAWEQLALSEAIGALFRGLYLLALTGASLAATPPEGRSPEARRSSRTFDIETLRLALAEAAIEPVRPYGHFGPTVLK